MTTAELIIELATHVPRFKLERESLRGKGLTVHAGNVSLNGKGMQWLGEVIDRDNGDHFFALVEGDLVIREITHD